MNRRPRIAPRTRLSAFGLALAGLAAILAACGGGPPVGNGPDAVINSPVQGSLTAGTFFFSVQPIDPSQVASVTFRAGSTALGTDTDASDGYRVFVAAADHPAGTLNLTATVTGKDGRTRTLTRTVTNVPSPPSSATVGNTGAALGTTEEDGSLSALIVPPGTATGANVQFEAMTQDEVKAATGVDYDALGITFLGAQDIVTSAEFDRTPGVSSGGFGNAVQPGQSVVNYLIGPDLDGDGQGEVYVVNTASVAPNGDVVSDPVPVAQVGSTASVNTAGQLRLAPLAAGITAQPGTVLELPVAGFNQVSLHGNLAVFEVAGKTVERFGRVYVSPSGAQSFVVLVPPIGPGSGTLTLENLGSGYASDPIDISVSAPSAVSGSPAESINTTLDLMLDVLTAIDTRLAGTGTADAVTYGKPFVDRVRANVQVMENGGRPQDDAALAALAARFRASGLDDLLEGMLAELSTSSLRAQQAGCNDILDRAERGMDMVNDFTDLAGYEPPAGDTVADMHSYALSEWWAWVKSTMLTIDEQLGGDACQPDSPKPAGPGTSATPSGMGAAVPPGGNVGGNVAPPNFRPIPPYSRAPIGQAVEQVRGRFLVSISVPGYPVPFKATTDAGGYFMVPMVPEGQPFTAVALDLQTGQNRTATGVGPALGSGYFLAFDFTAGESEYTEARWDGDAGDGEWQSPTNWEGDMLPLTNSNVVIPAGSGSVRLNNFSGEGSKVMVHSLSVEVGSTLELSRGTLELLAPSSIAGELLLTNGTIQPLADLVISGTTTWYSGAVSGSGTLFNDGVMTLDTDQSINPRSLDGHIVNRSVMILQGTKVGGLTTRPGTTLVNVAGAEFEVRGVPALLSAGGAGTPSQFDNHGTIIKSSGAGVSEWKGAEVNHLGGTVEVQAGTLLLAEGTHSTGATWEVGAGAFLALGSQTRELHFEGDYSGSGAGVVRLAGGDFFEIGAAGATFDFPDGGLEWTRSEIRGPGVLTNAGSLHVVSVFNNRPTLAGHLENLGTVVLRGDEGYDLLNSGGASIVNALGGTFEFHDDLGIDSANVPLTFTNAGSMVKVSGSGVSTLQVCYVDEGGMVGAGIVFDPPGACTP